MPGDKNFSSNQLYSRMVQDNGNIDNKIDDDDKPKRFFRRSITVKKKIYYCPHCNCALSPNNVCINDLDCDYAGK